MMKYFDKDFFKFTFGFLIVISISLLLIAAVSAYASGIDRITFTTEPQTVKPNEISAAITIQTQDTGGVSMQTPETLDLVFTSSSPTGEFLNVSGSAVTKTMNKNTRNRTFYYRDLNEGSFTITVKATGRDFRQEWSADQIVTISSSAETRADDENNTDDENKDTGNSDTAKTASIVSAHSGPGVLWVIDPKPEFQIYAGEDRLTSVGSPVTFQTTVLKNTIINGGVSFLWSFGDGSQAYGPIVNHVYRKAGNYVVVVNSKAGDHVSIARFSVRVILPKVDFKINPDSIEVRNESDQEINLFNWKIVSGSRQFVFPQDTIILSKATVIFDEVVTRLDAMSNESSVLKNALDKEVFRAYKPASPEEINEILAKLDELKKKIIALATLNNIMVKSKSLVSTDSVYLPQANQVATVVFAEGGESSSSPEVIYEEQKNSGGIIGRLTNFIKSVLSK